MSTAIATPLQVEVLCRMSAGGKLRYGELFHGSCRHWEVRGPGSHAMRVKTPTVVSMIDKRLISGPKDGMLLTELGAAVAIELRACRVCGCTQNAGCPQGCWWVEGEWDLCSSCVGAKECA